MDIWTKCNYCPPTFEGEYIHLRAPIVCSYPMIIDFVSMYPSIMSLALISPRSIDYMDIDDQSKNAKQTWVAVLSYWN